MTYAPGVYEGYEKELLAWLREKANVGLSQLKKEDVFNGTQRAIDYVDGRQLPTESNRANKALSVTVNNKIRKIAYETSASLTDVRPIWNYTTMVNEAEYQHQAEVLNKLARAWWRNSRADKKLESSTMYSCVGGSGYAALTYNADLPGGGDLELTVYDPRDVVPIDPVYGESLQEWRGVILRQVLPVEQVKAMYPSKAGILEGDTTASWFRDDARRGQKGQTWSSTMWQLLRGSQATPGHRQPGSVDYVRVYLKDDSIHTGDAPKQMGDPDKNWSYEVLPVGWTKADGTIVTKNEARLYPRGRLIICTPSAVLLDIPNPSWHGMFPVIRFTLDPLPWGLLGTSLVQDLIPLQDTLNDVLRGAEDGINQWIHRGVKADEMSISKTNLEAIDTRRGGFKALLNPSAGQGFEVIDGPTFPTWFIQMPDYLTKEMESNSGVLGLQQLAQLKQMPAADTVEQFMEALSPLLKRRVRSIEIALSELAEMLKVGFYQYYDAPRRLQILGKDGLTVEDFDYDPKSMVPYDLPGDTREERARNHYRNFTFQVAPDSFLSVSHTTRKMLILQLFKSNAIDIYTLWESMDLPNLGTVAAESIPDRMADARAKGLQPGPTPDLAALMQEAQKAQAELMLMQSKMQMMQMQAQMQMAQMGPTNGPPAPGTPGGPPGQGGPPQGGPPPMGQPPGGGPPPGMAPRTNGVGPQGGRPSSDQAPPRLVSKDGGSRSTISTSGR